MQQRLDVAAEALVRLRRRERPASARVAQDELLERLGAALEEDVGQPAGRHHADRVAVAARVFGRDQPLFAGDANEQRTPLAQQRLREALVVLALAQVAAQAQLVVQLVGVARGAAQLRLDLLERSGVEQVAQLLLPEQLAQEIAVERQRLRAPFGGRRVVLVHVASRCSRRAATREYGDADAVSTSTRSSSRVRRPLQEPLQRRQVEHVLQALAVGLEDDRERAVPRATCSRPCAFRRCCQSGVR